MILARSTSLPASMKITARPLTPGRRPHREADFCAIEYDRTRGATPATHGRATCDRGRGHGTLRRLLLPLLAASGTCAAGCTNFVFTGTSAQTAGVVREAMTRIGAAEESTTRRPDLSPEELEMTFLLSVRPPSVADEAHGARDTEPMAPPSADAPAPPADLRTIFVRIVPWGDDTVRQRTITIDAWRWHGVPPMWGGSAQAAQLAANEAMNQVLAERR